MKAATGSFLDVRRPADAKAVAFAVVAGAGADLAVRSGVTVLAGALLVAAVSMMAIASGRLTNPQAIALVGAAPVFGMWFAFRSSPWLLPLDLLAAGGLLAVGASFASGGSVLDVDVRSLAIRGAHGFVHGMLAPGFLRSRKPSAAVVRGLAIAVPLVVVLGMLLASGDAVFGSFVRIDPASAVAHVVLLTAGAWGMLGLLRLASATAAPDGAPAAGALGRTETTIVLTALDVLFGAFVASQALSATGGAARVLRTTGLTYAEYARSGFFQLLAVAAITLAALLALRALSSHRNVVGTQIAIVFVLVVVAIAFHRLELYERVFGLTMLRLSAQVFAAWIGIVFVLLGVATLIDARWFVAAAIASGLVLLFACNVVNPEAVVVRHNVAHVAARFDPAYLGTLSDDAVPAIAAARLSVDDRDRVVASVCRVRQVGFHGWAAWNMGTRRAMDARAVLCTTRGA